MKLIYHISLTVWLSVEFAILTIKLFVANIYLRYILWKIVRNSVRIEKVAKRLEELLNKHG